MEGEQQEEKNYGFVINNRSCIGCHACSTACKSENEVPLGVNRTWVKYTESGGEHTESKRNFQVTRCNHCENPPCVRICPVTAMYQRDDGIVEFDPDICIGCKACMQACPYDAIHIDPDNGTAAKCHYCAHRVEVGLEPACTVVCPTHSIIAGDMNDPDSEISQVLADEKVTVRKPEQGTAPKVFYIDGDDVAMHPTATRRSTDTFMFADNVDERFEGHDDAHETRQQGRTKANKKAHSGTSIREPQSQGMPEGGPIQVGQGRQAGQMVQTAYNAQHKIPWHWQVPAYLVTKSIASGVFLLLALAWLGGLSAFSASVASIGGLLTVFFLMATTGLLVADLERPERFLSIVYRPQMDSWLARGAFLLIGFSGVAGAWWLLETAGWMGWVDPGWAEMARPWLLGVGSPLAVGAAVYTGFLFGQAEGRDLWQSALLPFHLLVQAGMVGAGAMAVVGAFWGLPAGLAKLTLDVFLVMLLIDLFVTLVGEFSMPHASEVAARAAHDITRGKYRHHFWYGSILFGHVLPVLILVFEFPAAAPIAGALAIGGLYAFEHAFVMAPQEIPNS